MKYRIVKRYYRNDDTGGVEAYYRIEYLGYVFSLLHFPRKLAWKPYKKLVCGMGDCCKMTVTFDDEKNARKYVDNLLKPVQASHEI